MGVLIVLLCLLQYRLWHGDGNILEVQAYRQRIDQLKQEVVRLRTRNQALDAKVNDLKNGMDAVEEHARWDLGMIKEGETFFQVIETPDQKASAGGRFDR